MKKENIIVVNFITIAYKFNIFNAIVMQYPVYVVGMNILTVKSKRAFSVFVKIGCVNIIGIFPVSKKTEIAHS